MASQEQSGDDRELLADLKQDQINTNNSNESKATKEHIAGAQGKFATALSQQQGDSDINLGGKHIARDTDPSGGEVDRDKIHEALHARAEAKIQEHTGMHPNEEPNNIQKGSEAARLQSAAEQYNLAREGKQAAEQTKMHGNVREGF